jgi:hypothetical protein
MLIEAIIIVALVIAFVVETVLTETENFGWSTLLFLVVGAACCYFNVFGLALWVKAHVLETLIFAGAYLVAGIVWSFIKWASYLFKYREQWKEAKAKDLANKPQWLENAKQSMIDNNERIAERNASDNWRKEKLVVVPETPEQWEQHYFDNCNRRHASSFSKPLASDNKSKIIAWMCFWPFSLLGTFINDPIRRLFNFLFNAFKATYQKLSDKMFVDLSDEKKK